MQRDTAKKVVDAIKELSKVSGFSNSLPSTFKIWYENYHILQAYANGQKIQLWDNGRNMWLDVEQPGFNPGVNYRVKEEIVEFEYEGKKYKINIKKAKEMGLIENV